LVKTRKYEGRALQIPRFIFASPLGYPTIKGVKKINLKWKMNGLFANYLWTMFWGSVFWIFRIMWFFPQKYKYRCIRVYAWWEIKLCCVFCFENVIWLVYVIWMWIDWYRKYQPVEPEYEACCGVREANESQTSDTANYN
jgi:hypothetical protein